MSEQNYMTKRWYAVVDYLGLSERERQQMRAARRRGAAA